MYILLKIILLKIPLFFTMYFLKRDIKRICSITFFSANVNSLGFDVRFDHLWLFPFGGTNFTDAASPRRSRQGYRCFVFGTWQLSKASAYN